jgi:predicted nucleic acid-binding protein
MVFPVMVLDSSFLISFFRKADTNNDKAIAMLKEHETGDLYVSDVILFETISVLGKKDGTAFAKEAYGWLADNSQVRIVYFDDMQRIEILQEYLSKDGHMSVADISVLYLARTTGAGVLAFDEAILGDDRTVWGKEMQKILKRDEEIGQWAVKLLRKSRKGRYEQLKSEMDKKK